MGHGRLEIWWSLLALRAKRHDQHKVNPYLIIVQGTWTVRYIAQTRHADWRRQGNVFSDTIRTRLLWTLGTRDREKSDLFQTVNSWPGPGWHYNDAKRREALIGFTVEEKSHPSKYQKKKLPHLPQCQINNLIKITDKSKGFYCRLSDGLVSLSFTRLIQPDTNMFKPAFLLASHDNISPVQDYRWYRLASIVDKRGRSGDGVIFSRFRT